MAAFFVSMEWTGQQQISFLLQSTVVGVMQGLLFDIITGLGRKCSRVRRVMLDMLWGPVAAIFAFFGSLVIMDGQLHPLLLIGYAIGLLAEHLAVGFWVSAAVSFLCSLPRSIARFFSNGVRLVDVVLGGQGEKKQKMPKK